MNQQASSLQEIIQRHITVLKQCNLCPRNCGADRLSGKKGFCGTDSRFHISSICRHKGEEPAISGAEGICNIFFSRCNLHCVYCQNWQISRNKGKVQDRNMELKEVLDEVIALLDNGCKVVGFVSPSHYIPQVKIIIETLRNLGRSPVFVYNTNGYDHAAEIKGLETYIDVYLPDFKYADNKLALKFSGVKDYRERATEALKEMYRQKGSNLFLDETGQAERGMIIRHLILPGNVENSLEVLRIIAKELSESVAISLMAQYWPTPGVEGHPNLGVTLSHEEYERVVDELDRLGFYKGWVQDLESSDNYLPDFRNTSPFEG